MSISHLTPAEMASILVLFVTLKDSIHLFACSYVSIILQVDQYRV